jgi:hypothetical protein
VHGATPLADGMEAGQDPAVPILSAGQRQETAPGGALADADYQRRRVKWYPLNDSDMRTLATTEGVLALFIALASFTGGAWVSVQVGLSLVTGPQPPAAPTLRDIVLPLLAGGAILFAIITLGLLTLRFLTIRRIKRDCTSVEVGTQPYGPSRSLAPQIPPTPD